MDVRGGDEQLTQQANQPAEPEQMILEIPGETGGGGYICTNMLHLGKVGDVENILGLPSHHPHHRGPCSISVSPCLAGD